MSPEKNGERRACFVRSPAFFHLNHAALIVAEAFGETVYLVGSSLAREDFGDVDLRVMLGEQRWIELFGRDTSAPQTNPLWSLLCATLSDWLSKVSGLTVDFQLQRQDEANEKYRGPRYALGMYTRRKP